LEPMKPAPPVTNLFSFLHREDEIKRDDLMDVVILL
jgi:hypothetical protein